MIKRKRLQTDGIAPTNQKTQKADKIKEPDAIDINILSKHRTGGSF
jgi:hypothetical protein